ncbi:MAG TPA: VWA domain-containing protein [Pyrinomonadaceae bacterium]|nr:VWA domain-containing protein [Chloracidobacterium sp.]MBP9936605.1 VWA domain-containing protein [Pyrinomonadaceae bacterium]MBK9768076.1 VWA domain-containing protein [Chloracidobacterium sp.]MBL0239057.1 VWA domain-containing protein [Chloracidobacterium sp.]HQY67333.1 VWA domain-containing protein [Pyrinomonadaceae bacterium]
MKNKLALIGLIFAAAGVFCANALTETASAQKMSTATPTPSPVAVKPTPTPTPFDDPNEIIKVDTELVNLNVRVVDRNNRPINDLQQKDFKIFEDNKLQEVDFFSRADVPTNYALVIDNSGSLRPQLEKVIEAGKILIDTNKPEDETTIVRFVGRDKISIEQPFTSNKADLVDALDNLYIEGGQTAIIDAVYLAVENVDDYEKSKAQNDRKRRALILVSDGEDRDSYYNEKQLFELLRESEVQIYVIGFVGDLSSEGGFIGKSPQGKAKAFLERMAAETGGKAYFPGTVGELPTLAKEISNELRTQYSIGYIPSNDTRDGTFRNIKVVVEDGPNKQKRIAVSRTGRVAEGSTPTLQKPVQAPKPR